VSFPTVRIPPTFKVQIATPFEGDVALSSSNCFGVDLGTREQIIARTETSDEPEDDLISSTSWLKEGSNWTLAFTDSFSVSSRCTPSGTGPESYCWKREDEEDAQEEGTRACTGTEVVQAPD